MSFRLLYLGWTRYAGWWVSLCEVETASALGALLLVGYDGLYWDFDVLWSGLWRPWLRRD